MQTLAKFMFGESGFDAAIDFRGDLTDYAPGSKNLVPNGRKQSRVFEGLLFSSLDGGRLMFQVGTTYGSLDDSGGNASGSLFSSIAEMAVYIGRGQVQIPDPIPGAVATNILRFLLKWNGSYLATESGPYVAGLPEPSAVQVGVLTEEQASIYGVAGVTGTLSVKYARRRQTTGGRSRASETSVVLTVDEQVPYAVVPAIANGQTHHTFFMTETLLGGIGLHFRVPNANPFTNQEYQESDVERVETGLGTSGTDRLTSSAKFTAGDIGKLVEAVSGFTVPAGTTVAEIVSSSEIRLSNNITVTSGSIDATLVSYVAGIRRAVVINYVQSDLIEETAWIYDFPPPTGSHAFQVENRMYVCGYADASSAAVASQQNPDSSAGADNPGTVLVGSIANHFESYDPRFPIYLPEPVVDILSDGMDSYRFIGCNNGIYAAQHLNVSDYAPLTISTLLKEGIQSKHNWCARERAIYLFTTKNQPVRIVEGGIVDLAFADKVKTYMRNWTIEDVVVFAHPGSSGVVYAHGNEAYMFDETTNRWSTLIALNDWADGNIMSAVSVRNQTYITIDNPALTSRLVFEFDTANIGGDIIGMGPYVETPSPQMQKVVQKVSAAAHCSNTNRQGYIGLHTNTLKTTALDGAVTAGSNILTSTDYVFTDELIGKWVLVTKRGNHFQRVFGRIIAVDSLTQLRIGTPTDDIADSVALNATATLSSAHILIAHRLWPFKPNRIGTVEFDSRELYLAGLTSYAVSITMLDARGDAQPLYAMLDGFVNEEMNWSHPSASFNKSVS